MTDDWHASEGLITMKQAIVYINRKYRVDVSEEEMSATFAYIGKQELDFLFEEVSI
jgi:hypothetical protein